MKAQVKFKDHERQFWLDMSERRAWNAYCMAGGKESWISYAKRRCGNRLFPLPLTPPQEQSHAPNTNHDWRFGGMRNNHQNKNRPTCGRFWSA